MEQTKKSRTLRPGRKIWSSQEDRILAEIIQHHGRKGWKSIAQKLNSSTKSNKTAKQCRERFRNYLDPTLEKGEWTHTERVLFVILHKQYGNQWTLISNFLNKRSDIGIKNHYYSIVRKSLRLMSQDLIPASVLDKPIKIFRLMYILEVIRTKYLSIIESGKKTPMDVMEKIVVKLIKEREASLELINQYEEKVLSKFRERNSSANLPLILNIDLRELDISQELSIQLKQINTSNTVSRLTRLIQISFANPEKKATEQSENQNNTETKKDGIAVFPPSTQKTMPTIDKLLYPSSDLYSSTGMSTQKESAISLTMLQNNLLFDMLQREKIISTIFPEAPSLTLNPSLIAILRKELASTFLTQISQFPNINPLHFSSLESSHFQPSSNPK